MTTPLVVEAPRWMADAACRQLDPALFYPESQCSGERVERARRVCRPCPVRVQCLEYALARETRLGHGHRHGVWGGASAGDRDRIANCRAGRCRHGDRSDCQLGVPR